MVKLNIMEKEKFNYQITCSINDGSHDELHIAFFGVTSKEPVRIFNKCANILDKGINFTISEGKITVKDEGFVYQPLKPIEDGSKK